MSYDSAKYIYPSTKTGTVFSGGLVDNTINTLLPVGASPYLKNCRLDGGTISSRPGRTLVNDSLGGRATGLTSYFRQDPTNDAIVMGVYYEGVTGFGFTSYNVGTGVVTRIDTGQLKYTSTNITIVSGPPVVLTDSSSGFVAAGIVIGDKVSLVIGGVEQLLTLTVANVTASTLTFSTGDTSATWAPGTQIKIIKSMVYGDTRMNFANIGDILYGMNGTSFGKINGTAYTLIPNATSGLPGFPSYGVYFSSCLWVAGIGVAGNKVYKSKKDTPEDFSSAGFDVFTFPENITGLCASAQTLFVFTKNTVHACTLGDLVETSGILTFSFKTVTVSEGAKNHECIVPVGVNVYYITPSNQINQITRGQNVNGFETVSLSDMPFNGISGTIALLNDNQTNSFGAFYPNENLIKWFLYTEGNTEHDILGKPKKDITIVYDVEKKAFLKDTNTNFEGSVYLKGFNYVVMLTVDVLNYPFCSLFKDEFGPDDAGGYINFEYWTKSFDEGEETLKKCYWESRTSIEIPDNIPIADPGYYITPGIPFFQYVYIDSSVNSSGVSSGNYIDSVELDGHVLPTKIDILRTKGNLNTRGKSIAFKFHCSVKGPRIVLKRLGYKVEVLPGSATDMTFTGTYLITEGGTDWSNGIITEEGQYLIV